eukprot:scaffold2621_cov124-Isochrysis_galbana.AAC.6
MSISTVPTDRRWRSAASARMLSTSAERLKPAREAGAGVEKDTDVLQRRVDALAGGRDDGMCGVAQKGDPLGQMQPIHLHHLPREGAPCEEAVVLTLVQHAHRGRAVLRHVRLEAGDALGARRVRKHPVAIGVERAIHRETEDPP